MNFLYARANFGIQVVFSQIFFTIHPFHHFLNYILFRTDYIRPLTDYKQK